MNLLDYLNHMLQAQVESMDAFFYILTMFTLPIIMINRLMRVKSDSDYYCKAIIYGTISLSFNFFML